MCVAAANKTGNFPSYYTVKDLQEMVYKLQSLQSFKDNLWGDSGNLNDKTSTRLELNSVEQFKPYAIINLWLDLPNNSNIMGIQG